MNMNDEILNSLKELLKYVYEDEKSNFESTDDSKDHIFTHIQRLQTFVEDDLVDEKKLRIDTFTGIVDNTNGVQMRIIHMPTGIVVSGKFSMTQKNFESHLRRRDAFKASLIEQLKEKLQENQNAG